MSLMESLAALAGSAPEVKVIIKEIAAIDEKRLRIIDAIAGKMVTIMSLPAAPDPATMAKLAETVVPLLTLPIENLREIHAIIDGLLKLAKSTPPEIVAALREVAGK